MRGKYVDSGFRRSDETLIEMEVAVRQHYRVSAAIIQNGMFYEAYNESANVLESVLGYKTSVNAWGVLMTGFPTYSLPSVIERLESAEATFAVVDQSDDEGFHGRRLRTVSFVSLSASENSTGHRRSSEEDTAAESWRSKWSQETEQRREGDASSVKSPPDRQVFASNGSGEVQVSSIGSETVIVSPYGEILMRVPADSTTSLEWFKREATKRHRYPRHGERWSHEEDLLLTERFEQGLKVRELTQLHQRAPGGIRSRLVKLGLMK